MAKAAAELRREAIAAHRLLLQLEDGTEDPRTHDDSAYRTFRDQHVRFLDLARTALEVR